MEGAISIIIYVILFWGVLGALKKKKMLSSSLDQQGKAPKQESSAMPHKHKKSGVYDTYNKKRFLNTDGAMPHKHETKHYTSMADASKLPPGYILLNGEPVRVADLEGK